MIGSSQTVLRSAQHYHQRELGMIREEYNFFVHYYSNLKQAENLAKLKSQKILHIMTVEKI